MRVYLQEHPCSCASKVPLYS